MTPTILLFDIDGTLISTGGAGRRAIERALEEHKVAQHTDFSFAGMTDRGIVRKTLERAGRVASDHTIDNVLNHYVDLLEEEVRLAPADRYIVHPGIFDVLDAAAAAEHVALGLGTGNVEAGARIKLSRVKLWQRFAFGGFGSDAEDRAELLHAGAQRGANILKQPLEQCRVVIIGDSPRDITASHAIGAECVAVATGTIDAATLASYQPEHLFPNLQAPGALEPLLGAPTGA